MKGKGDTQVKQTTMGRFEQEEEGAYQHPALCIPRGLGKITHKELASIINKTGLGNIHKIIIKPREFVLPEWERTVDPLSAAAVATDPVSPTPTAALNEKHTVFYNNIYIYFKKWNTENPVVRRYRNNLIEGKSIKIVHSTLPTPIFWRCVAAKFHR
jgi:hypothetical protein